MLDGEALPAPPHPSILLDWDGEFYRTISGCAAFIRALPPCSKCGQVAWKPDGMSSGTFRLKCSSTDGTLRCGRTCAASAHREVAARVLAECQQTCQGLKAYKAGSPAVNRTENLLVQRTLIAAPKRMAVAMTETQETPEEVAPPTPRETMMLERITALEATIASLERALAAEKAARVAREFVAPLPQATTPFTFGTPGPFTFGEGANVTEDTPARKKAVLKAPKNRKGDGQKKKPSPPALQAQGKQSFVDVAMARMPPTKEGEFLTFVGKGKKPLAAGQPLQLAKKTGPQAPRRRIVTDDDLTRFLTGQKSVKKNGLSRLYVSGIGKAPISDIRQFLAKLGIERTWVRNISYAAENTMEMLVFDERKEEIAEKFRSRELASVLVSFTNAQLTTSQQWERQAARYEREANRPQVQQMHTTKRMLLRFRDEARAEAAALKDTTPAVAMDEGLPDMDMTTIPTSA